MEIPKYVLDCLELYRNASIPSKLIRRYGIAAVEKELAERGYRVEITKSVHLNQGVNTVRSKRVDFYIAWVKV